MRKIYQAITLSLFIICLFPPSLTNAKTFNAESFTLDNGLQVVVIPNHRAPVITHMVWYKVGAADEKQGLSGMAHYFEHLMFKGTDKLAPGEFSRIVKNLGGNDNAFTGQDYTAYFQSISVQHLEKLMRMEADRMVNLKPPKEGFMSEKKVVLEERRQRTENDPRGLFSEQMQSALYVNHPYGTPVIGWLNEIKNYEWEDVKEFYDTWYAPNNAIVIISGDVTAEQIKPMAESIYGVVKPKTIMARKRPEVPPAIGDTTMTLKHPQIHQPAFQKIYLVPSSAQNKQDSLALQVLQEVMSGGATTRLYKNLVVDQKKAVSASLSYRSGALDYASLWVSGTPAQGIKLEELENLIEAEIINVIENGVTENEVKDAIQRLEDQAVFARDSLSGPAMIFGQALTTGSTIDAVENWSEDIATVTPAKVQDAAKKYLSKSEPWIRVPITGYLRPIDKPAIEAKAGAAQ